MVSVSRFLRASEQQGSRRRRRAGKKREARANKPVSLGRRR